MQIKSIIIYYFSGTGNSKNVALWVSNVALKHNIPTQIINITNANRALVEPPASDALIVFASPVHGFNYPPIMLHFIMRFPKGKNNILLMNTRAGMLIGKFITPGLTGIAFYLSSIMLKLKGYSIVGMIPVDLPSNWISVHPGLNERTVKYLHEKNKEKVSSYMEKIIAGKTNFKSVREIIQDILISPIALLYYFIGRFAISKTYYASSDCNGCDICIKSCPVKGIIKLDNRPFWTFNCESCMKCMSNCPKKAIETGHGFVFGVIIFYSLIIGLFYRYFSSFFSIIENETIIFFIKPLVFLIFLGICYCIIHYLMRLRAIERFMVYTSLTKYKFWGRRYKALTEKLD
ncbi:MAG: hypothetical protein A2X12_09960 [Bacteroidetes bacterium GWE2_29_8]|nr:MAG: hypothetical protein A2X12_09960 [Bacteroidetes bacterium GWE2_29_8]OFY20026.1 MAG: hypothetical protein A2X02_06585 [Bacteroidetes bacterium GWF2_29_10]